MDWLTGSSLAIGAWSIAVVSGLIVLGVHYL
jgi:hypothetical protein